MPDGEAPAILLLALAIDIAIGDPAWLYRRLPHPVAAIGRLIARLDQAWNDAALAESLRARRGLLVAIGVIGLGAGVAWLAVRVLDRLPLGWVIEAVLASTLIAYRGLHDHVRAVARGLRQGLDAGRAAVAHVVGRDPRHLDPAGVARAAIETLAENLADGTIAPLFWYLVLGLPGLVAYKAINTLDSMIGHQTPRHAAFGRAAARIDDWVNWVPARLAGGLIVGAAAIARNADAGAAWRVMTRDAPRHRSPNAGWPEAAMAGALGLALNGPRRYGAETVDDAWMGAGRAEATASDIDRALRLYRAVGGLAIALLAAMAAF